jgi:hypothetical protein
MIRNLNAGPVLSEQLGLRAGRVIAQMYRRDPRSGLYLPGERSANDNVRILAGRVTISDVLIEGDSAQGTGIKEVATGDGNTAPLQTDSAMGNELDRGIGIWDKALQSGDPPKTSVSYQFQPSEANGNNKEAGLFFDDASMLAHARYGDGVISGATKASPCVITSTAHGLTGGDSFSDPEHIYIQGVGGMTELNGNYYFVKYVGVNSFSLYTDVDLTSPVNSTGYGTFTTDGEWLRNYLKTASEIFQVTWVLTW